MDVKKVEDAGLGFVWKRSKYPTECLGGFGAVSVGYGHVECVERRVIPSFADQREGGDEDLGLSIAELFEGVFSGLVGEFTVKQDGGELAFLERGVEIAGVIDTFGENKRASPKSVGLLDGVDDQLVTGAIAAERGDHRGEVVVVFVEESCFDRIKGRDQKAAMFFEVSFLDLVDDIAKVHPKKFLHPVFSVGCGGEGDAKARREGRQQLAVGLGGGVVGFIDDDQAELIGDFVEFAASEGLNERDGKRGRFEVSCSDHTCFDAQETLGRFDGLA